MTALCITGGNPLYGEIRVQGSKNAVLPILAATLLIHGKTRLKGCPKIADVHAMLHILEKCGAKTIWEKNDLWIDTSEIQPAEIGAEDTASTRACVLFMGAMLARCRMVQMAYPGGCAIGVRPINYHLDALKRLGVQIDCEQEKICCHAKKMQGTGITLAFPSVGATQNIILAAVGANGVTRVYHAAREPEVVWLCSFLKQAGARIEGIGTANLVIEGGMLEKEVSFAVPPDRIVTGTYMAAVMAAGGEVLLEPVMCGEISAVSEPLLAAGAVIKQYENKLWIKRETRLKAFDYLRTEPYPGFPTDMQSVFLVLAAIARGTTVLEERIFEARFGIVPELKRMGAEIWLEEQCAIVAGKENLHAAQVFAGDLRGAAALLLAGLAAQGTTVLRGLQYLDRGYEDIELQLAGCGARLFRTDAALL